MSQRGLFHAFSRYGGEDVIRVIVTFTDGEKAVHTIWIPEWQDVEKIEIEQEGVKH